MQIIKLKALHLDNNAKNKILFFAPIPLLPTSHIGGAGGGAPCPGLGTGGP